MASVNKVILLGNVGRDPEMHYLASGHAVCNISIATTTRRKDKTSGQQIELTEWHRVTFYDRLAEIAGEYVKKGRPVYIEGRLKYGEYTDNAGVKKHTTDIIATELQLLGARDEAEAPTRQAPPSQRPQGAPQPTRTAPAKGGSGFDDMDDDVPY